jgi:hypothetical protein
LQNLHYSNKIAIFVFQINSNNMAAPKNNKNASKWSEERVQGYLSQISRAASKRSNLFLGKVLEELGLYKDVWSYWQRKFAANEDMMEQMEMIKTQFEVNVFKAGMEGRLTERFAIMCLKRHYGWSEHGYRITDVTHRKDDETPEYRIAGEVNIPVIQMWMDEGRYAARAA